jgi:pectinesterase
MHAANEAIGFIGKAMTFENTAGPANHQAVAFRNQGDMSALVGCHIVGYQDSLYVQTNRQFYRNCVISGTIDFIFGFSATLIQQSTIIVRKPGNNNQFNVIIADGSPVKKMNTGIVIQDCNIIPEVAFFPERFTIKSYLGRPWKNESKIVVMESTIGDFIHPDGWTTWPDEHNEETCYFAEYANTGPGANVARRVKWKGYKGVISRTKATKYTAGTWLQAGPVSAAKWLHDLHVPHYLGFKG